MEKDIYEIFASAFYSETGMMAPGKDDPIGNHTPEKRKARWDKWFEELREESKSQSREDPNTI